MPTIVCPRCEYHIKRPDPAPVALPPPPLNPLVLTREQHAVAVLVGGGLCNKDIAERLGIAEQTVKNYLRTIFDKAKVDNRLALALLVMKRGVAAKADHRHAA